jgi:hypothetical protein
MDALIYGKTVDLPELVIYMRAERADPVWAERHLVRLPPVYPFKLLPAPQSEFLLKINPVLKSKDSFLIHHS